MFNNNNKIKTRPSLHEDIEQPHYEIIPMDLNFSPLEHYFKQSGIINNVKQPIIHSTDTTGKTLPVIIPGSSETLSHDKKKRHHKRRRKPVAQTLPENGLEASLQRRRWQESIDASKNKEKLSQAFIVGSLQEKTPVPWPSTLTMTPDNKYRNRSENRQSVNWPLVPQHCHRFSENDQEDIFDMDNDDDF
ncbi:hypothetical protein HPULCUR_006900 [Helicostylum pulchrum]|uniref:Uncharacterized protein n=1 Tax=Helicostylum pulchrum TaxID=562976 RepID=A0ABP9Y363_9FUNG